MRWGWLSFLAAELLLASLFVVFTTITTHRAKVPVLKSSTIATLVAPVGEVQQALGSFEKLSDAEERAKQVCVRLENRNLVLVSESELLKTTTSVETPECRE